LNAINDSGNGSNKNNGACYYNKKIAVPATTSRVAVASTSAGAAATTKAAAAATPAKSHQKATKG